MVRLKKEMKGGSKVKVKKETEEERAVRAEMQALQEEEERRKREEQARLRLRQRQLNEERYAKINSIKIHNQWRKIMRLAKVEDLRKEIEILSQNHEREVDRKDAIIQMLDRDLEDAEEQYQMALRSHLMIVDALIDLQYTRVKALEEEFTNSLCALEEEFETERTEIINAHMRQKKDIHDMMAAMEHQFQEVEHDARQEFESQREEIKNRNSEEYNVLKISLESTIEELERHFEQAHQAYLASTDARTQSFRQLTKNDAASARIIEKRMRKLIRLQDSLAHWRTKIATNSREWEERNRSLRNEKDIMSRHYQELKGGMNRFRGAEGERLKQLSINSGTCIKELEKKLKRAEKILQLAELNRKMETEQEKVLPFYKGITEEGEASGSSEGVNLLKAEKPADGEQPETQEEGKVMLHSWGSTEDGHAVEEWDYLTRFFQRYNKVAMDKAAIEKEKVRLSSENEDLRSILKQYLDGISVNEDVINNPGNPLMMVNNKLKLTAPTAAAPTLQYEFQKAN
mmetsp:Transcript_36300/g.43865  ORF Transcript_36300/g.43865 Transcript_36300/m.43865 type:complete len:516 (-) Transcript_36300:287-1834(-)|eukprot:CAMPEP_0197849866 /NCGR_PEP_ID=MMETSP1438-20131217/13495_1 /TAXON_ID=1461541 /ORGANISM="Pterosperma sp., Strain CCMP1384" /LENGTH=515 /DNA_ID=CAMNT_0043462745 /DNA_START=112 /DNA_END=1659 /DNA_ORIENTATION=+